MNKKKENMKQKVYTYNEVIDKVGVSRRTIESYIYGANFVLKNGKAARTPPTLTQGVDYYFETAKHNKRTFFTQAGLKRIKDKYNSRKTRYNKQNKPV